MSDSKGHLQKIIQTFTEAQTNLSMSLPKITVVGQNHLYVENHEELILFTETELTLKLQKGYIHIKGEQFVLKAMLQREILLEGIITHIEYVG